MHQAVTTVREGLHNNCTRYQIISPPPPGIFVRARTSYYQIKLIYYNFNHIYSIFVLQGRLTHGPYQHGTIENHKHYIDKHRVVFSLIPAVVRL